MKPLSFSEKLILAAGAGTWYLAYSVKRVFRLHSHLIKSPVPDTPLIETKVCDPDPEPEPPFPNKNIVSHRFAVFMLTIFTIGLLVWAGGIIFASIPESDQDKPVDYGKLITIGSIENGGYITDYNTGDQYCIESRANGCGWHALRSWSPKEKDGILKLKTGQTVWIKQGWFWYITEIYDTDYNLIYQRQ